MDTGVLYIKYYWVLLGTIGNNWILVYYILSTVGKYQVLLISVNLGVKYQISNTSIGIGKDLFETKILVQFISIHIDSSQFTFRLASKAVLLSSTA